MIQAVRGTKDILSDTSYIWHFLEAKFRETAAKFCYNEIRTPIFEKTEVFSRSIGDETDIVNKEMYTFEDKGGESLTLRPEGTSAIVRSAIQNSLLNQSNILRAWYFGPFFRYERPQKGRQRQFHQFGCECIGSPNPESDAEVILLASDLFDAIGIKGTTLLINTLGDEQVRATYRDELIAYFSQHKGNLSEDSLRRLGTNPLRILDSKDEGDIEINKNAPKILDCLNTEGKTHFDNVLACLDAAGIRYEISPELVRGLDYYSNTVFEFRNNTTGSQDSIGGGGRYNGLFEALGGKPAPAVGFAMGVERLILTMESLGTLPASPYTTDAYIIASNDKYLPYSVNIANLLRKKGLTVTSDLCRRSFKSQFKEANKFVARYAVIIGDDEFASKSVTIKNMQTASQETLPIDNLDNYKF